MYEIINEVTIKTTVHCEVSEFFWCHFTFCTEFVRKSVIINHLSLTH